MAHACASTGRPFHGAVHVGMIALLVGAAPLGAQSPLASAQSFAVLGGTTVTNTGVTSIVGDLGTWPGGSITGLGTIALTGTVHPGDPVAMQAHNDALSAFNVFAGLPFMTNLSGQDLGGRTLTPGVYHFASSAQLTGALVLDFLGNPTTPFVFQIGSTLTTAAASMVSVLNGSSGSGIYWQVGSSATLGAGTMFAGNIIADQTITLAAGTSIQCGRAIALNAAVTMNNNVVSNNCVDGSDFGSYGFSGGPATTVPEPSTLSLFASACGLFLFFFARRENRRKFAAQHDR